MTTTLLVTDPQEVLHPSDLGAEFYAGDILPEATKPPQFVGFQCLCCEERHADLIELIACQDKALARAVQMRAQAAMLQVVTAPA